MAQRTLLSTKFVLKYNYLVNGKKKRVPKTIPVEFKAVSSKVFNTLLPLALLGIAETGVNSFSVFRKKKEPMVAFRYDDGSGTLQNGKATLDLELQDGQQPEPSAIDYIINPHQDQKVNKFDKNLTWRYILCPSHTGVFYLLCEKRNNVGDGPGTCQDKCNGVLGRQEREDCLRASCFGGTSTSGETVERNVFDYYGM